MIVNFRDQGTEDIFNGRNTRAAQKCCPRVLWSVARRKLDQLNISAKLEELRVPPGNRFEALRGDRAGRYSIRVNDQFRICFEWTKHGPANVELVDYH